MSLGDQLWRLCHVLRHEGVDYGDYVDQLANLIYLRFTADNGPLTPYGSASSLDWSRLACAKEDPIGTYDDVLESLAAAPNPIGEIFASTSNLLRERSALRAIIRALEDVPGASAADVLATAFEELLYRAASESKKGAGQYFTPRPIAEVVAEVMRPAPDLPGQRYVVGDPACGVGGFLVAAHTWASRNRRRTDDWGDIASIQYRGADIAARPRRLALINLHLHQMEGTVELTDSLYTPHEYWNADVILTNPPFGVRGGSRIPDRPEFWYRTTNKQLNFLQHAITQLADGGHAAIVLPDTALNGPHLTALWEGVLSRCAVHTMLRLPSGAFAPYAPAVRTAVLFLRKTEASSETTWIYDARINLQPQVSQRLNRNFFKEFIHCYSAGHESSDVRRGIEAIEHPWYELDSKELFLSSQPTLRAQQQFILEEESPGDGLVPHLRVAINELQDALVILNRLIEEPNDGR